MMLGCVVPRSPCPSLSKKQCISKVTSTSLGLTLLGLPEDKLAWLKHRVAIVVPCNFCFTVINYS